MRRAATQWNYPIVSLVFGRRIGGSRTSLSDTASAIHTIFADFLLNGVVVPERVRSTLANARSNRRSSVQLPRHQKRIGQRLIIGAPTPPRRKELLGSPNGSFLRPLSSCPRLGRISR
jgi:hypothetical protein